MKSIKNSINNAVLSVYILVCLVFTVLYYILLFGTEYLNINIYTVVFPVLLIIITFTATLIITYKISHSVCAKIKQDCNADSQYDEKECFEELLPTVKKINSQNALLEKKLAELNQKHEEQDRLRREFTANVSHELKTPLTSISGYAELIRNGIAKSEDISRFAEKICVESQRLITLTGDIIKLSELDDKELEAEPKKIDLYSLCESIIAQLDYASDKRGVKFILSGEHITITAPPQVVEEMIFNICDNAVKYNKTNGSVYITIKACVDGVELSVKDTGIGIPKSDIPYVFERFYRVDKSHSKEIGGTGLGLSIVKHCASYLNVGISLESELGVGTCIKILF